MREPQITVYVQVGEGERKSWSIDPGPNHADFQAREWH